MDKVYIDKMPTKKEDCIFSMKINSPHVSKDAYFCTRMPCGGFCVIDTHKCPILEEIVQIK